MPEWLVERGIGETRAALVDNDEIIEARIELDGVTPAGSVIAARLANTGTNGRNAVAIDSEGTEYLLPRGPGGVTQGAALNVEVKREAIPGAEPWKRPLATATEAPVSRLPPLAEQLDGRELAFPSPRDELVRAGWNELVDQAQASVIAFPGGELRISATTAMTLIDVDGYLAPEKLAVAGAAEAAKAIRRLDIGGSIGIDLPTVGSKQLRQRAAEAIDAVLPPPFERTAVNGFGFVQIVRPRQRASLIELAQDRVPFAARALLRRAALESPGAKRLVGHPAVVAVLSNRPQWLETLSRQVGGAIELRADVALPMSSAYAESV